MPLHDLLALVMLLAVVAYGVLAGADFGGGVLDLLARGPRQAAQREAIAHAMGPVWEANHVWLIFVIVLLFTGFPAAHEALGRALFLPFHLVLAGIALRGAAFVFRSYGPQEADALRRWGRVFGAASAVTPVLLGMCLGAVSSGDIRVVGSEVTGSGAWLRPVSVALGVFALGLCTYVGAVFLTVETEGELQEDFRRRALAVGTAVVVVSAAMVPFVAGQAPHLWAGLVSPRGMAALVPGVVAALASGWALWQRRFRLARVATVVQVGSVVAGWGLAQHPYVIYPDVTTASAAAPRATLVFTLGSVPFGLALLLPSLWLLFRVFKGRRAR